MRTPSLVLLALAAHACVVNPVPTPEKAGSGGAQTASEATAADAGKANRADAAAGVPGGAADAGATGGASQDAAAGADAAADAAALADAAAAPVDAGGSLDVEPAVDASPTGDVTAGPDAFPSFDAVPQVDAVAATDAKAGLPLLPPADAAPGLQYNGSVAYLRKAPPGLQWSVEFVEISAPIVPKTTVLYPKQGPDFPQTKPGMAALAHEAALTYDFLLTACQADYPGITLLAKDAPNKVTKEQLLLNYQLTAECGYKKWVAKPYWIPKLVDEIDICATELGPDWSLLTEADVTTLTAEQAAVIADGLTAKDGKTFGSFYYSTSVFVRAAKGLLMTGKLEVGTALKTIQASMPCPLCFPDPWTYHLEGGYGLRCLRTRGVAPPS